MFNSLSPILFNISYDSLDAKHKLLVLIASSAAHIVRFSIAFPRPDIQGNFYPATRKSSTILNRSHFKAKWSALKSYYALFDSTESRVKLFITIVINKTWFKDLKDAELCYTAVSAAAFLQNLRSCSGGLHDINVINLTAEMMK